LTPAFRHLLITDRNACADLVATVAAALRRVPAAVLLHERDLPARAQIELVHALRALRPAALLVSGRCDVALATDAAGVHLHGLGIGPTDARGLLGPKRLIGVSCHSQAEVRAALQAGADYATFGPVFDTPSKRAFGPPLGLQALADAARLGLPLFALGGVDPSNAGACRAAGAHGIAAIRAFLDETSQPWPE